jgi:hypothetical protein
LGVRANFTKTLKNEASIFRSSDCVLFVADPVSENGEILVGEGEGKPKEKV